MEGLFFTLTIILRSTHCIEDLACWVAELDRNDFSYQSRPDGEEEAGNRQPLHQLGAELHRVVLQLEHTPPTSAQYRYTEIYGDLRSHTAWQRLVIFVGAGLDFDSLSLQSYGHEHSQGIQKG